MNHSNEYSECSGSGAGASAPRARRRYRIAQRADLHLVIVYNRHGELQMRLTRTAFNETFKSSLIFEPDSSRPSRVNEGRALERRDGYPPPQVFTSGNKFPGFSPIFQSTCPRATATVNAIEWRHAPS